MSYINDALRKAQQDKKSPYTAYEPIVSAAGGRKTRARKWFPVAGILILLVCAAGMIVLFSGLEEKKGPAKAPLIAEAPIVVSSAEPVVDEVKPVLQEARPVVEEITIENKPAPVLKTKKADEKTNSTTDSADSKKLYAEALRKHQEGKLDEAKDLYKKVITIDPANAEALNNLGVIYMKKKVYKWAIIRLNDAIRIKYDYPDAHYNLACIYAQNNNVSRSISYLKNAVGFNPQVRQWALKDKDLSVLADLPEFKKLLETK